MPLVINTPGSGWVKGIGYDVLVNMLNYMSPTHVVKIRISAEKKNLPAGTFWLNEGKGNVIEINNAMHDNFNRSVLVQKDSHLVRDLRVMAYFRQCFSNDVPISTIKELARALAAHLVRFPCRVSKLNIFTISVRFKVVCPLTYLQMYAPLVRYPVVTSHYYTVSFTAAICKIDSKFWMLIGVYHFNQMLLDGGAV